VDRFVELGDQCLKGVGLDRQPEAGLLRQDAAVAGGHQADRAGSDPAAGGLDADDAIAVLDEAGDLAVLE
jgi:hypothetical protein